MKTQYDSKSDAAYIYLRDEKTPIARTVEVSAFMTVDLDEHGKPIGIELFDTEDYISDIRRMAYEDIAKQIEAD